MIPFIMFNGNLIVGGCKRRGKYISFVTLAVNSPIEPIQKLYDSVDAFKINKHVITVQIPNEIIIRNEVSVAKRGLLLIVDDYPKN